MSEDDREGDSPAVVEDGPDAEMGERGEERLEETVLSEEGVLKDAATKPETGEEPAAEVPPVEEKPIVKPIQLKRFSFSYDPHILDHLAYSGDRNSAHINPLHVKQVLLSLESQPMLHADKLRFEELREKYADEGVRKKRKELLDEAVRLKIREFGPKVLALDHPLIFPGAESVAYSERFIPADEFVAKVRANFLNPLLIDMFKTAKVNSSLSCTEYPSKGMKEHKIVAEGDLFGEKATILEMDVVTFDKDAADEEEKFVHEEFERFSVEKGKEGWVFNDTPVRDVYHEKLLVTEQALTDYLRSIDMNGASSRPKYISPFAIAALLPRLLITLADQYRSEHQAQQAPEQNESERKRFELINEYVAREEANGTSDPQSEDRVNTLMARTLQIYNSQSGIFSRRMSLRTNENFNLAVFLTRYNPKKGKFEFVAEARQGWKWPWAGDNRVFVGAGDALEQPLYNEVMMEYVLERNLDLKTMKPFGE